MKLRKNNVSRVLRGGGYYDDSWIMRVLYRIASKPEVRSRFRDNGFRFVIRGKP
jgi:hypothetical protein